ncbi:MAG: ferredoxin family protein [Oscillospiraceae bacterium]
MKITIDSKWCKGCALCVRACKGVLAIGEQRSSGALPDAVCPEPGCLHRLQDVRAYLPRCLHRGRQGIRGGQNRA